MTARSGRRTAPSRRLNLRKYAALVGGALPRVIENDEELERVARIVELLLEKSDRRTVEEETLSRLLISLIDGYQRAHPRIPRLQPHEALQALMEAGNLRQTDLAPILGSRSRVSDAVNGKRAISKAHARKLAEFFRVSPELFI